MIPRSKPNQLALGRNRRAKLVGERSVNGEEEKCKKWCSCIPMAVWLIKYVKIRNCPWPVKFNGSMLTSGNVVPI